MKYCIAKAKDKRMNNNKPQWISLLLTALLACVALPGSAEPIRIPVLTPTSLQDWEEEKIFKSNTQYESITIQGKIAVKAHSSNAASGLVRKLKVNLTKTPYLHWSWRIDNVLDNTDETTREGDDYPARIYVIVSGGLFFWKTKALNYVWSSSQAVNTAWPNAYTENAHMLTVRTGAEQSKQWQYEKRNVLQDLQKYLQTSKTHIDAVAIMTDTDNSGQSATAYYGEIYFSDQ